MTRNPTQEGSPNHPELVWPGKKTNVPIITFNRVGELSTFDIDDWNLPKDSRVDENLENLDQDRFRKISKLIFQAHSIPYADDSVDFSPGSNTLIAVRTKTKTNDSIQTAMIDIVSSGNNPKKGSYPYRFQGVHESHVAIALQRVVSNFMFIATNEMLPTVIGNQPKDAVAWFSSSDLGIPFELLRKIRESGAQVTNQAYREKFITDARKKALALEYSLRQPENWFDESGLLTMVSAYPGDASTYDLEKGSPLAGQYTAHNVMYSGMAILYHNLCGTFIRDLQDKS